MSSSGVNTINTSTQYTQNLWCRDTYWKYIVDTLGFNPFKETHGSHLRSCRYTAETCRGAHRPQDIKPLPNNNRFSQMNKGKIEWVKIYINVIATLKENLPKIINEEHKRVISNVDNLNFIQAIQLWRDMSCHYRKIAKEIPKKASVVGVIPTHSSGFKYYEDVPGFYLDESIEDTAWAFERITRWCPVQQKFEKSVSDRVRVTVWDLCLANGLNCKEGIHKKSELLCVDDFLNGSCSCQTLRELEEEEFKLQTKLIELSTKLLKLVEEESKVVDDGWSKPKGKSKPKQTTADPKVKINEEIKAIQSKIEQLQDGRMIHYSELGLLPFVRQLEEYKLLEEERERKAKLEKEKSEAWDHGMVDKKEITKPVVKLVKLGKKK